MTCDIGDQGYELFSESGQRVEIQYASWTKAGCDPYGRAKSNQDSYNVTEFLGGENVSFFGVFDGHGGEGAKVSQHLVQSLPRRLSMSNEFKTQDYVEMFEHHMPLSNKLLLANQTIKTQLSGSTAATAILDSSGMLTVANVGDSRCILGRLKEGMPVAVPLTTDHTPEVAAEAARITACRGRIQPYIYNGEYVGPKRIWLHNKEYPGLAMTRSFGDALGSTIGIIADPEIVQVQLRRDDKYLVLCSDGISEFMNNDYIMSLVHHQAKNGWSPSEVAKCLVEEANRQWMENEDGIIDDCTVIVIYLTITPPTPTQTLTSSSSSVLSTASLKSLTSESGPDKPRLSMERSVSKTLSQVARRASALLTPRDIMQKCSIGSSKK